MSLALLFYYLLLNMFRMLVHQSSAACDLLWIYFMCCIALVRCVGVMVWFGWGGVVSLCRLKQDGLPLFNYQGDARSSKLKYTYTLPQCRK